MAETRHGGELEIEQDLPFQNRQWAAQRVGGVLMALVAAGLLGLVGTGPLSAAAIERGPLRVEYGRFERNGTPTKLTLRIAAGTATDGTVRVWLDEEYLDGVRLQNVSPEPDQVLAGGERTIYVVAVADPGLPANVGFDLEPAEIGRLSARLGLVDGPEIEFTQFVYP